MIYTGKELIDKFRINLGDSTADIPEEFVLQAINWAINELPRVPKLYRLFGKHKQVQLSAKGHYRWSLNSGLRYVLDIPSINFWSSTGGDPCKLKMCPLSNKEFFDKHGIISLKQAGTPCEYTIEREGDNIWLTIDRPSDIPIILDYFVYGIPEPLHNVDDKIELSGIAENLLLDVMAEVYYKEAGDFAFAADISSYLDNKKITEAIQALYKTLGCERAAILGER